MKAIQRAMGIMACGLSALAVAPTVSAEAQPGFYVGLSGGESTFDLEQDMFDGIVLDVFFSAGAPILSGSSTFEDSDTAISFFGGYQFSPHIAVELGYTDLGAAEYRSTGTVNPPGPIAVAPAGVAVDIETTGFTLSGIGSIPLGSVVDLHGELGFFFAETELAVDARIGSSTGREVDKLNSNGVYYAIGAGFHFGEHWSMSLDWTRYDNVGDEDEDDDADTEAGFDIDALTLSAMFRF